ncbi:CAP domain-containing protein [Nitrosomonas sp. Nm166]|uniref:CAP domain-containing protein n=1 Tax=Nitrosomonas sp. Nm166 TaxID=1881054 RepID=UPI0008EF4E05|nr:CAP domain-containing protein [Nitrosomonas sp. Nm166]SFE28413.1 Hemolysin-type calcium-binding repeat-containing protein [Nitrosomonas sp. Nm166]
MSQANAYEQYMLELINAERAKVGAQPLAFDGNLNEAAENHSSWMIATDTFSHTGAGGSSAGDRMEAAGYTFSGSWTWGENIAWRSTRTPSGLVDEVEQLHTSLMNSSGHRANILNDNFREIGVGLEVGSYKSYEGAFVTQDFARTGTNSFLTGVAFDDLDGDKRYDINEGLGSFAVSAKNNTTGAITTVQTSPAGGYELTLASGNYTVSFSSNGFTTAQQVSIGSKNVKLDLIDPTTTSNPSNPTPNTISGTSGSDTLSGTSGDDVISGLDGSDKLYGSAGNDKIDGGSGDDKLWGNSGTDTLTGGTGKDILVFNAKLVGTVDKITDFTPVDDVIYLQNAIFTNLTTTGTLNAAAFYIGTQAHDSTDRVIYNAQTGALSYDADGIGGATTQQFAQLTGGLVLTNADFYVV